MRLSPSPSGIPAHNPVNQLTRRWFIASVSALVLTACGGGWDDKTPTTVTTPISLEWITLKNYVIDLPNIKQAVSINWKEYLGVVIPSGFTGTISSTLDTQWKNGVFRIDGDILTYTPNADLNWAIDSITVTVTDGKNTFTATVNVKGINTQDIIPDAFAISPKTVTTVDQWVVSDPITVSGISAWATVNAVVSLGGEISKDNGVTWTSGPLPIILGNTIILRQKSPQGGNSKTVSLALWDVNSSYTVTTTADDTPDAWNLGQLTWVPTGSVQTKSFTISWLNKPVAIAVSGGATYTVQRWGATITTNTVQNGDIVTLRVPAANSYSTPVTTTVTVWSLTEQFVVTTEAEPAPVNNAPSFPTVSSINAVVWTWGNTTLPAAIDTDNDPIIYSTSTLPAGFSFNSSNRAITWTAGTTAGTYTFNYVATDSKSSPISTSVTVVVSSADTPTSYVAPTFTVSGNQVTVNTLGINDTDGTRNQSYELLDSTGTTVLQANSTGVFTWLSWGAYKIRTKAEVKNGTSGVYSLVTNPNTVDVNVVPTLPATLADINIGDGGWSILSFTINMPSLLVNGSQIPYTVSGLPSVDWNGATIVWTTTQTWSQIQATTNRNFWWQWSAWNITTYPLNITSTWATGNTTVNLKILTQ